MKTSFGFIDPGAIMGVVVALIILVVGVFAFFVTVNALPSGTTPSATTTIDQNTSYYRITNQLTNTSDTAGGVFNIVGIVMIIGAIMAISILTCTNMFM